MVTTVAPCPHIIIQSFGGCSISAALSLEPQAQRQVVSPDEGRAKKHWTLIEYLVLKDKHGATVEELIDLLWPEQDGPDDPGSALRLQIHRARAELNRLELCRGAQLILFTNKAYRWNPDIPTQVDANQFIQLYETSRKGSVTDRLNAVLEAIDLYKGRFLPKSAHQHWVMTLDAYYHTYYITMCEEAVGLLKSFGKHQDIVDLCQRAIAIDPYVESLHIALVEALSALGLYKDAAACYNQVAKMLMSEFGTLPSEALDAVYSNVTARMEAQNSNIGEIRDTLLVEEVSGALHLEYPLFRQICHLKVRESNRSGQALQLCLLSLSPEGEAGPHGENDSLMLELGERIQHSLRQGDMYTRYSAYQYLVLLQSTSYENGLMVLERITKAFLQAAPTAASAIQSTLLPLQSSQTSLDAHFWDNALSIDPA